MLEWGKSLISFQPTLQTARQVESVTVTGWNVQTKKAITKTATRADLKKKGEKLVMPSDLGVKENSLAQKQEVIVDRAFKDEKEAQEVAEKTLKRIAQGLVEAKGKTIGLPDLRAGGKIDIHLYPSKQDPPPGIGSGDLHGDIDDPHDQRERLHDGIHLSHGSAGERMRRLVWP